MPRLEMQIEKFSDNLLKIHMIFYNASNTKIRKKFGNTGKLGEMKICDCDQHNK